MRANPFWRQPPVYSPVPRSAVIAATQELAGGRDSPARLADLLRRLYAADQAILCASGTMALQLAIRAAIERADAATPVALPAFTCYDVATAAVGAGAKIALYDIDPDTLGPDLDSLEAVLGGGARVVVVAPLFGMPVDWEPIERLAAAHGALVIEDAAQGHGARWNGRPLGGLAAISVLSFGRGKGWTAGGGGALLVRSGRAALDVKAVPQPPAAARAAGDSIAQLKVWAQWALGRPALYGVPALIPWLGLGETRYREPALPRGMGPFTAALLIHSRAAAEREAERRRRNGQALATALAGLGDLAAVRTVAAGASPGFLRLPARIQGGLKALAARDPLSRLGVLPSYPKPLARLPAVASLLAAAPGPLPGAEALARELLTVPTHSLLADRDRQQLLRLLDTGRPDAR